MSAPSAELLQALQEQGLATDELLAWLHAEEVETRDDLAALFRSEAQAKRIAPCTVAAWQWANIWQPPRWQVRAEGRAVLQQVAAGTARGPDPAAAAVKRKAARRAVRPRAKAPAGPQRSKDAAQRREAATEAVARSISWGPGTGALLSRALQRELSSRPCVPQRSVSRVERLQTRALFAALCTAAERLQSGASPE